MKKTRKLAAEIQLAPVPHSWPVRDWPSSVFPNSPASGAWLARTRRTELIEAGALIRVGHQLAVIGPRYLDWLGRQAQHVVGYEPNNKNLRANRAA